MRAHRHTVQCAAAPAERKCFRWEKRGRCNKGDACEFVHSGPGAQDKPKRGADEAGSGERKEPEPKKAMKNKKKGAT